MQVLKFGGTSVGSTDSIKRIKDIVLKKSEREDIIVVVSALGGITTQLLTSSELAAKGDESYLDTLKQIEKRYIGTAKELIPIKNQAGVISNIKVLMNELEDILRGVFLIHELSPKTSDKVLSYGEILSAHLIASYFVSSELDCQLMDPKQFIITDDNYGRANVDFNVTNTNIIEYFSTQKSVRVCPGFIASTKNGEISTLGRGGSDYTAAIIAGAVEAVILEIWSDVNGMMTADPRLVTSAYTIEKVSYEEAMELSHFGAKVLYPPTIQPILEKNIPINIKNTFDPENPGTYISSEKNSNGQLIKGLSSIQNIALFNLTGSGMVGIPNFSHRLFGALSQEEINIIMITQASSEHSICVGIDSKDVGKAKKTIRREFAYEQSLHLIDPLEIEEDLAIIALVGSNMRKQVGVSGKMLTVLGQNGINIKAIAQGSSEKNISVVIREVQVKKALSTLHESFFLSEKKRINLFMVGVGNVGGTLLEQLKKQQNYLDEHHHVNLRVVALANSRKMHFDAKGIDLDHWSDNLEKSSLSMDLEDFIGQMQKLNLRNSVFIDNTADSTVASVYNEVLKRSISVVTPNKIACTESYQSYLSLKYTALKYKSKFLFETNVGAGLPVINTLNDLIKSGDEVLGIQAVLSGSLNFIFNNFSKSVKFVDIVKQAQEEGYTEPDPRIDLSGVDVKRKILILLRESGMEMELEDITADGFIPDDCMNAQSIDKFFEGLAENEQLFQDLLAKAYKEGKKLKYVASYKDGKAVTGLQMVDKSHPFYNLEGKDNIVLFTTKRYPEQPLVIKGAGAGAEVTASGIFADIMRIANE